MPGNAFNFFVIFTPGKMQHDATYPGHFAFLPFFTSLLASRMVKCQTRRLTPHCCVASGARIDDGCGFQGAPFKFQFLELTADL